VDQDLIVVAYPTEPPTRRAGDARWADCDFVVSTPKSWSSTRIEPISGGRCSVSPSWDFGPGSLQVVFRPIQAATADEAVAVAVEDYPDLVDDPSANSHRRVESAEVGSWRGLDAHRGSAGPPSPSPPAQARVVFSV